MYLLLVQIAACTGPVALAYESETRKSPVRKRDQSRAGRIFRKTLKLVIYTSHRNTFISSSHEKRKNGPKWASLGLRRWTIASTLRVETIEYARNICLLEAPMQNSRVSFRFQRETRSTHRVPGCRTMVLTTVMF